MSPIPSGFNSVKNYVQELLFSSSIPLIHKSQHVEEGPGWRILGVEGAGESEYPSPSHALGPQTPASTLESVSNDKEC